MVHSAASFSSSGVEQRSVGLGVDLGGLDALMAEDGLGDFLATPLPKR